MAGWVEEEEEAAGGGESGDAAVCGTVGPADPGRRPVASPRLASPPWARPAGS